MNAVARGRKKREEKQKEGGRVDKITFQGPITQAR